MERSGELSCCHVPVAPSVPTLTCEADNDEHPGVLVNGHTDYGVILMSYTSNILSEVCA